MDERLYNISVGAGIGLIGAGIALWVHVPAALVVVGALVLTIALRTAGMITRRDRG